MIFRSSLCLAPFFAGPAFSMVASPHLFNELQPDDVTQIRLRINGDENFRYFSTEDGYTVVQDDIGYYTYGNLNETGYLVSTAMKVGFPMLLGELDTPPLRKGIIPSEKIIKSQCTMCDRNIERPPIIPLNAKGRTARTLVKNLVILIRFKNHVSRTLPSRDILQSVMNGLNVDPKISPAGSVRNAYLEMSYGRMDLESFVTSWITVPGTEQYYADNNYGVSNKSREMFYDSLNILNNNKFNFKNFDLDGDGKIDAITFLHSGYGAEWGVTDCYGTSSIQRIWSHKFQLPQDFVSHDGVAVSAYHVSPGLWGTCGSDPGHIAVICHETGHFFGLRDMYDTNSNARGINLWGLMGAVWGWDGSQNYPPHFSAWSKEYLGFTNPEVIYADGVYTLRAAELFPDVFKIILDSQGLEYLLIENRQPLGIERIMPGGGLAIWHIDMLADHNTEGYPGQSGWPQNGKHYKNAVLQADGAYNLERGRKADRNDLWHAGGKSEIGPSTGSNGPYPNTDAYMNGIIKKTGIVISEISKSSDEMTFRVTGTGCADNESISFGWRKTCTSFVALYPEQRCNFMHNGMKLRHFCRKSCDNCKRIKSLQPTKSPFYPSSVPTSWPTYHPSASPTTNEPTQSLKPSVSMTPSYGCSNQKPFFCNVWVKTNPQKICKMSVDDEFVKDLCRKTCANCPNLTAFPTPLPTIITPSPTVKSTSFPSSLPSKNPSISPTGCIDDDLFFCNLWVKKDISRCSQIFEGELVEEHCRKTCSICT